jgi:hypothetical protein
MSRPRIDMPPEGTRPTLKWAQALSEAAQASRLESPDHLILETPSGTVIEHTRAVKSALRSRGVENEVSLPFVNIFTQTSSTEGDWTSGKVYFQGQELTVTNEPSTIAVDASRHKFWIEIDFSTVSAEWKSGIAFPTPPMGDALEWYRMLDVTLDVNDEIVSFVCPTPHDIHVIAKSF